MKYVNWLGIFSKPDLILNMSHLTAWDQHVRSLEFLFLLLGKNILDQDLLGGKYRELMLRLYLLCPTGIQ